MSLGPRNQSRDVNDHLGFLNQWASEVKKAGHFSLWEHDELVSQAYLTTHDLLTTRYKPERGTVITYLKNFLWPRVAYAYGKYHGWRYRNSKWIILESELPEIGVECSDIFTRGELPPDLTEQEIDVILMKVGGMTHQAIAAAYGYRSPTTVTYWIRKKILPKFRRAGLLDG